MSEWNVRPATLSDMARVCQIHNEGIEDRTATLDLEPHTLAGKEAWFTQLKPDEFVLVIEEAGGGRVEGFATLTRYSPRKCYDGVGVLSIYLAREYRGKGLGSQLLGELIRTARERGQRKIILRALLLNERGLALYEKMGFQRVGVYKNHGKVDEHWVDVLVMELLL